MTRRVEVHRDILHPDDVLARALRHRFADDGVLVTSVVSEPGAGKTTLIEATRRELGATDRVAALALALDARTVSRAVDGWTPGAIDLLFIEQAGPLAAADAGEHVRVVLVSAAEGADAPLERRAMAGRADAVIVTKIDVAAAQFDRAAVRRHIAAMRPGIPVFELSAVTGEGMDDWIAFVANARLQ